MNLNISKRHIFNSLRLSGMFFLAIGVLIPSSIPGSGSGILLAQSNTKDPKVSISVKDSTIGFLVQEIAKQAGHPISYDNSNSIFGKRISVKIEKATAREALGIVLQGTDHSVVIANDARTIIIRPRGIDTVKKNPTQGLGTITGKVIDSASKNPISGATVSVIGTSLVSISSSNGSFRINNVQEGKHSLSLKMMGYSSRVVKIDVDSGRTAQATVFLVQSTTTLSEVVTTVTGKQRRAEIATDIVKIDADKIRERSPVRNVVDLIEAAQVPGIFIQHSGGDPGSPSRIRIRGIGSISQSNDPVMIVDGVWIDAKASFPSRLDNIDPASIESIEIIRGPSAATLYGQDASNGVIVITTKKGQVGQTRWNLSYNRDWGQTYGKRPLVYNGIGTHTSSTTKLGCSIREVLNYTCIQDTVIVQDPNNPLVSTEGVETNNRYTAQIDGGGSAITYMFSVSSTHTIGVRKTSEIESIRHRIIGFKAPSEFHSPSKLNRNAITGNIVLNPRNNVTVGISITGSQTDLKNNVINNIWQNLNPSIAISPLYSIDTFFSPLSKGTITTDESPVNSISGLISGNIQYRPKQSILINSTLGIEKNVDGRSTYRRNTECIFISGCVEKLGDISQESQTSSLTTIRLNASTNLNLGSINRILDIKPSIGGDYKKTDNTNFYVSKRDLPVGSRSLSDGTFSTTNNTIRENALAGWYINSTIGLFQRIYFDAGIRQDIGSAITSSKNTIYPKIGGSWIVSDEKFWKQNPLVTSLRFRSAIGHSAVQPDVADIDGRFVNASEYIDGVFVNSVNLVGIGNRALSPERAVEIELGLDADFWDDRINIVGTYAHKENRNTLVVRSLPESFGALASTRKENVAKVRNRNFELSANGRAIESRNLLIVLNYTLTLSDNKVLSLGDGIAPFGSQSTRIEAGYPIGAAWGKKMLGYEDRNGDGMLALNEIITADSLIYKGWSQPRYRAGYGINISLRNGLVFDSRFAYQSRYVQQFQNRTGPGTEDTKSPLPVQAAAILRELYLQQPISDLRWNSASVTLNVPKEFLEKIGSRSVSISLQGRNLGLWTNYSGRDPAINSLLGNGQELSADSGLTTPRPRLYVLDFKVGF